MNFFSQNFDVPNDDQITDQIDEPETAITPQPRSGMHAAVLALREYIHDPAYITGMRQLLIENGIYDYLSIPKPLLKMNCAPPVWPEASAFTAVQIAMFDNWPQGVAVQNSPNRYGLAIEAWTCPGDDIIFNKKRMNHSHKSSVSMMNFKSLKNQIKVLRKPRANPYSQPSADYLDTLNDLASALKGTEHLIGLVNTHVRTDDGEYERGVYYHPFQFVLMQMANGRPVSLQLQLGTDNIVLPSFSDTDANGKPHGRKIIGQSRCALVSIDDEEWQTRPFG